MLSKTSSSSEDMRTIPLMAFLMSCRLWRTTWINRLNRINSWFRTVFIDSSYLTGNLFCNVECIVITCTDTAMFWMWCIFLILRNVRTLDFDAICPNMSFGFRIFLCYCCFCIIKLEQQLPFPEGEGGGQPVFKMIQYRIWSPMLSASEFHFSFLWRIWIN